MNVADTAVLSVERTDTSVLKISLDSPRYEPGWEEVKTDLSQLAFAGRDVCFFTFTPPVWDVSLDELASATAVIDRFQDGTATVCVSAITADGLQTAVSSTDFALNVLLIAAIPLTEKDRIAAFAAAWSRRSPLNDVDTLEEYMACIDDKWLYWHNYQEEAFTQCKQMLEALAAKNAWRLSLIDGNY